MKFQKGNGTCVLYLRWAAKADATYHRLSAAPGFFPFSSARRSIFWRNILSDMHTARRAGGNNTAFTLVVVFMILLVIGGFVWRTFHGEPNPQPAPAAQGKENG